MDKIPVCAPRRYRRTGGTCELARLEALWAVLVNSQDRGLKPQNRTTYSSRHVAPRPAFHSNRCAVPHRRQIRRLRRHECTGISTERESAALALFPPAPQNSGSHPAGVCSSRRHDIVHPGMASAPRSAYQPDACVRRQMRSGSPA